MQGSVLTPMEDDQDEIENSLSHVIPRGNIDRYIDETVYNEISERLRILEGQPRHSSRPSKEWSKDVRLYTLLSRLGHRDGDQIFKKFEDEGIGDLWLPLDFPVLEQFSSFSGFNRSKFMAEQRYAMSDSKQMNEQSLLDPFFEQGHTPSPQARTHRYLEFSTAHFKDLKEISKGGSAYVLHVQHKLSGKKFVCKRFPREIPIEKHREQLKIFEQEVTVLKSIRHHHIVRLVASITDLKSFSIILYPAAGVTLLEVLKYKQSLLEKEIETLSYSFNCLATALTYLHKNSVLPNFIEPNNILLSGRRVLLYNFGISLEWKESENSTTGGTSTSFTRRYAAPEVHLNGEPQKWKADVWSLGCVFLEIISAVKGCSFDDIDAGECVQGQRLSLAAMKDWLEKLRVNQEHTEFDVSINWTQAMINQRLNASEVVGRIHKDTRKLGVTSRFLAPCCRRPGYDSPSSVSISSARMINRSSNSRAHDDSAPSLFGGSSLQSYRNQPPSVSQGSESLFALVRNPSIEPAPVRLPPFWTRQDRGDPINACNTTILPSRRTSTTTHKTSSRSNSSSFEAPETLSYAACGSSDVPVHDIQGAHASTYDFSRFCRVRDDEELLFKKPIADSTFTESVTIQETSMCCNKSESTVQVFETARESIDGNRFSKPPVWMVTRRVVLTNVTSPNTRRCCSFWLPLADICYSLCGVEVILKWSDCNQPRSSTQDDYKYWSRVYDPEKTNNTVNIKFHDLPTAKEFLNIIRFSMEDGSTINFSDSKELRIWTSKRYGKKEGIVSLTHHQEPFSDSTLFVVKQYIDPRIQRFSDNCSLEVRLNNIAKPNYLSDFIDVPTQNRNRVANFHKVELIQTSFSVSAPPTSGSESPIPPPAIAAMFQDLTGWRLEYFASIEQLKSERHAMQLNKKRYGRADVMVWRKRSVDTVSARVTFRLLETLHLSKKDEVWISGRISASTYVSSDSRDPSCCFEIFGKKRGHLLDMSTMTAVNGRVLDDPSSVNPALGSQQELRLFTLKFSKYEHCHELAKFVEDLRDAIAKNPTSDANRASATRTRYNPPTPLA